MPPEKRVTKKSGKSVGKRATKRPSKATKRTGPRKMSAAHKAALSEGRTMSATVDRYLSALNTPKRRGRKVSKEALQHRLAVARERARSSSGVDRVVAAQEVRDLTRRLAAARSTGAVDIKSLEVAFVKVAKKFGENRGITYGAWRDAGVPADALRRAGIARTRG